MTVKEMKEIAKKLNIVGFSKMKKAELEEAINNAFTEIRETIPCDGQILGSFCFCAAMAAAMRILTENEYEVFLAKMATVTSLEEAYEDAKLRKLICKIPSVFQIRHEGCKGIVVKTPLEFIPELKDKDLIVPEGARKFVSTDWEESPLEICNYLKKKGEWVALNPQFIQALKFENPNALVPVVDFWFNYLQESVNDIAKAQEFHGIISSVTENGDTVNANLVSALRNSSDLVDDFQIINWRKTQYEKFINDMKIGRLLVPGQYTYMVCDPMYLINDVYGLNLNSLKSGEYWFNDHVGNAAAFRSPLIAPFEAQKFSCIEREDFWYYKDIVIFNGFDGAWENMGGGDFDGDTCAIVPDSTELGRIIVNGVRQMDYVVWEKALSAVEEEFSWENLAKFNAKVATPDRTGIITNYASRAMDIANHLEAAIWFAKNAGCDKIYLFDPAVVENNNETKPYIKTGKDGLKYFCIRGFVKARKNKFGTVRYENGYVGSYSFEQIQKIADEFLTKVEYIRLLQGREIDGAKTGVGAEGISGEDFVDSVKVEFTPHEMLVRSNVLKKDISDLSFLNKYQSLSPLARLHDYVEKKNATFTESFKNGSDKVALLMKLLTAEETKQLRSEIMLSTGENIAFTDYIQSRKKAYGNALSEVFKADLEEDDNKAAINGLKEKEISELQEMAEVLNFPMEVVAVACYIAAYAKNGNFDTGLTYGWLLFNELLSVFTRNNKKFELYRLPAFAEEAYLINGSLYVNGKKYAPIADASDAEYLPIQVINGKKYALIHKVSDRIVEVKTSKDNIGKRYVLGMIYGFKYNIGSKEAWQAAVKQSDFEFQIDLDNNSRMVTVVDGQVAAAIKSTTMDLELSDLVGCTVKVKGSPDYAETDSTIQNLVVEVVA